MQAELLATSPAELAKIAIERGKTRRGRKVFYESGAACFACHDPPKGVARLGPDLAKVTTKLTAEQLVESILRPSKLIDKDYAQVSVLDVNGKVQTGVRISESDQEIVLRNLAEPEPIKIKQDDIEEVLDSNVSLMPETFGQAAKEPKGLQ